MHGRGVKGDMSILDIWIDGASGAALERVNVKFELGVPRGKWLVFSELLERYRERVRGALRAQWMKGTTCR